MSMYVFIFAEKLKIFFPHFFNLPSIGLLRVDLRFSFVA